METIHWQYLVISKSNVSKEEEVICAVEMSFTWSIHVLLAIQFEADCYDKVENKGLYIAPNTGAHRHYNE